MNAFISYSHQDNQMLDMLHKHLAQLRRDKTIATWTDRLILAGGNLDNDISTSLENSQLFIALLSPDYIASNYCYEKEFQRALQMLSEGKIIIVPIILEPCDWQSTPFGKFKALPNDGKAVSTWENKNNAFLDITQNLRKLVSGNGSPAVVQTGEKLPASSMSRNYKVKKDFDSIQKIEFRQKTYQEITDYLKRYTEEVIQLDGIKVMTLGDTKTEFESLIVNRNKIETEARLKLSVKSDVQETSYSRMNSEGEINYTISTQGNRGSSKGFSLAFDDYHLFWKQVDHYSSRDNKELTAKEIADLIWDEWLETVGIL
ncbi:toll/interleukin-1 receptor domain-containing protein [Spirosoma sp. RP8]|uniref:Toll/interleukin-1 receptor domain-containing protein n=1 Tax=Spirosoma liriopis TaxID=2937440 RepID=A0ABT0HIS0_9BACT|nr:toll/interleukin-1 receptor domain-containing protein [Spirosoma liriopis]MCK8491782.1 toll/interleukin-1 receptor domain-containing protein [Spirosoma liriopis]